MSKTKMSRRSLFAGGTGAVLASLAIVGLGPNKALAAGKQPLPDEGQGKPTDQPDGLAQYEMFKASGLL